MEGFVSQSRFLLAALAHSRAGLAFLALGKLWVPRPSRGLRRTVTPNADGAGFDLQGARSRMEISPRPNSLASALGLLQW